MTDKDIQSMSEEELIGIIRMSENTNVPGSLHQRARQELELRDREKLVNAHSVSITVAGQNNGIISAAGHDSIIRLDRSEIGLKFNAIREAIEKSVPESQKESLLALANQAENEVAQPTLRQKALGTLAVLLSKTSELATVASLVINVMGAIHGNPPPAV